MSEMVERAARALWEAHGFPDEFETYADELRRDAYVALKTMREPTEEMIDSGYAAACDEENGATQAPNYPGIALNTWYAMIDDVLR